MAKGANNGKLTEESNALMANGRSKLPEKTGFKTFLYNKEAGTCLGRTAKSWAGITIFYIIFYICLALFWCGCLWLFLKTTDPQLPRYYGKGTIIGANPGVGYQPWIKEDPESTLIKFDQKYPSSYQRYISVLDKYFAKYENTNNTRECSGSESNKDIVTDGKVRNEEDQACRFNLKPFQSAGCMKSNDYGFKTGEPCVVVSLNRLIGWVPHPYDQGEVPDLIKSRYKPGSITIACDGTHSMDREVEGDIQYIPPEGIDGRYYPYAVMDNYHQPFAMVKFKKLPVNRVVMIQCRAFAKNIEQDPITGLGFVRFELVRQDKDAEPKEDL